MEDLKNQIINKAGFLVYTDYWEKYFSKMTGEQIKETLKIVFHFTKTFEILQTNDLAVEMVIATWIDNIKRDAIKRTKQAEASKENGKLGGRPKGKQKVANASKSKQKVANLADSDSKNKSESESKKESDNELPIFINKNLFDDFVKMRIKIKKPMTEEAVRLLLKKLTRFEEKQAGFANQALEDSITSSYQGVFEPRANNLPKKQTMMSQLNEPRNYEDRGGWDD